MPISKSEWNELNAEFESDLDDYMEEWSTSLEEHFASAHAESAPVPDQRQDNSYSCGVAALQSVLGRYGIQVAESDLTKELGTSPEKGTSPQQMLKVLRGRRLRCEDMTEMKLPKMYRSLLLGYPILAPIQAYGTEEEFDHRESGHWVVVTGVSKEIVTLQDPSHGPRKVPIREFLRRWRDRSDDGKEYHRYGIVVMGP